MTGISSDGTRLIFPSCGLSYADVTACGGMNQKQAAKKLGVNYAHFNQIIKRLGASHWFDGGKPLCVSKEDVIKAASAGRCQIDTAEDLGISGQYLHELVMKWGLRHLFPFPRKQKETLLEKAP
jgi:transposase